MTTIASEGLTSQLAERLLAENGPNALPEAPRTPFWLRLARQLKSPIIYILLFALAFDVGTWVYEGGAGWPIEGTAILAVLILNAGLGAFQEYRSEQALARLKALATPTVWALRNGKLTSIPTRSIVPGDVVRLEAGERVPADGVLIEAEGVLVDEAVLTGESVPVDKAAGAEVKSGTLIVRGKGFFRVDGTGPSSTMGKLATMLGTIEVEETPLEKRLSVLGRQVARWVGVATVVLAAVGLAVEGIARFDAVVLFAVALAVAAVPEGMPAVVTLTLALGVQRMAKRQAVVRRLSAVEALGSVTVIATDKTGTLTENRMVVRDVDAADLRRAALAMTLANDADGDQRVGDPIDVGLLDYARAQGIDVEATRASRPRKSVRPFDSEWKFMRVTVEEAEGVASYFKGAPEVLLTRCVLGDAERAAWTAKVEAGAAAGHRLLALAVGRGEAETELTLLGLVHLWDPPRAEVPDAIRQAQQAGVRVMMFTGDHPGTARAIAERVGLGPVTVATGAELEALDDDGLRAVTRTTNVFARVTPEHKLRLVEALKAEGEIVAVTGDGVNDAPALKRSDVGIAMGTRGSDVSREVADLVLLDDNFATIVGAIAEGRSIYENLQTYVRYTFSTNVALMLLVLGGALGSWSEGLRDAAGMLFLPLTALQLLWINFLGDGPPSLALAVDRTPGVMSKPPRAPKSDLLDPASKRFILATGVTKGLLGLALLLVLPVLGATLLATQTAVFLFESVGKLFSAYPARRLRHQHDPNPVLHGAVVLGVGLQILTVCVPGLRHVLSLAVIAPHVWAIVAGAIAAMWIASELSNAWARRVDPAVSARSSRA